VLVTARIRQRSGARQGREAERGELRIVELDGANLLGFFAGPFQNIDRGFPLGIGELDSGDPFRIGDHFKGNWSLGGLDGQRALENGSTDSRGA
jgi:hypothetical protein